MSLTDKQGNCILVIKNWLKEGDSPVFILKGYAGTGKTFLLDYLQLVLQEEKINVIFCTPTGKSASVLTSKLTGAQATTIHRAFYRPYEYKTAEGGAELGFEMHDDSDFNKSTLIVVDEASMLAEDIMLEIVQKAKVRNSKILFVGDPMQLPPVNSTPWFIETEANFFLDEILRQAADNPIIRLSMAIRNASCKKSDFNYPGQIEFIKVASDGDYLAADQILCGKNNTRAVANKHVRKLLFKQRQFGCLPREKLICLSNCSGQSNGDIILVESAEMPTDITAPSTKLITKDGKNLVVDMSNMIKLYDPNMVFQKTRDVVYLDYGYAITVHKSQGSEFDSVLLLDDKIGCQDRDFRIRWLYTAITRAKKRIIWLDC